MLYNILAKVRITQTYHVPKILLKSSQCILSFYLHGIYQVEGTEEVNICYNK